MKMESNEMRDSRKEMKTFQGVKLCISESQELLLFCRHNEVTSFCLTTKQIVSKALLEDNVLSISFCGSIEKLECVVLTEKDVVFMSTPYLRESNRIAITAKLKNVNTPATFGSLFLDEFSDIKRLLVLDKLGHLWVRRGKQTKSFEKIYTSNGTPLVASTSTSLSLVLEGSLVKYMKGLDTSDVIYHRFSRAKALTCITMGQSDVIACGNTNGNMMLCYPNIQSKQFVIKQIHWHSLPVRCLSFSLDEEHLFSGGAENVLIKWDTSNLKKEELVPRIGAPIDNICVAQNSVAVALADFSIKCFDHQLRMNCHISPFMDLRQASASELFWHPPTSTIAYLKQNRNLNFYDPKYRKDILTFEVSQSNLVTGDREVVEHERPKVSFSPNGLWLVSHEARIIRIWNFSTTNKTFIKVAQIVQPHDSDLTDLKILEIEENLATLVTCGFDREVHVWSVGESCHLIHTFSYKKQIPWRISTSHDHSVIAVAFDNVVTLWSFKSFTLRTVFQIESVKHMDFPQSFGNPFLFAAQDQAIFIINCITLEVSAKIRTRVTRMTSIGSKLIWINDENVIEMNKNNEITTTHKNVEALDVVGDTKSGAIIVLKNGTLLQSSEEKLGVDLEIHKKKNHDFLMLNSTTKTVKPDLTSDNKIDRLEEFELTNPLSQCLSDLLRIAI